jgi:heat shock protein HslJ
MKRISLLLIVILLAGLLAACGGEEATSPPLDEGADTPAPEASTAESPSPDSGTGVSEPSPEAGSNLSGILWKWESYTGTGGQGDITVSSPDSYTMVFIPSGELAIQADCNVVSGSYTQSGSALSLELGPSTMAFCGEESLDQQYLSLLNGVSAYVMSEGKLVLNLSADAGSMTFQNGGPAVAASQESEPIGLIGPAWQWTELAESPSAETSVVPTPESYTLNFLPDNSFNFLADCNSGSGSFAADGQNLNLQLGPVTAAECGSESLFNQYLALLGQVSSYEIADGGLTLYLDGNAGQMSFGQAGQTGGYGTGIDIGSVSLDTLGLPYSWQPNVVPGTAYDASQPPGPVGLPDHVQVNFGTTDASDKKRNDPVIYIIPMEAYWLQWELNGDPSISTILDHLEDILAERPLPVPSFGMPSLPMEEITGVNDLAVQGKYLDTDTFQGVRFVGRFAQDASPVTNDGMRYIFQGFSSDGQHLISFFYPVTTDALPYGDQVTSEEQKRVEADTGAYLEERANALNGFASSDWAPDLATLDAVIGSLTFETTTEDSMAGITDTVWQWSELIPSGPISETVVADPENYRLVFHADGQYSVQADCNSGGGTYTIDGINLNLQPGPMTTAECGPDSQYNQYLSLLEQVRTYAMVGKRLLLNLEGDAGRMVFGNAGPPQ